MPVFKLPNQSIRWLLAELVVVVLGILIAFQADQWRESQSERTLELQYLQEMLSDLDNDRLSLERGIAQRTERLPLIRELITRLESDQTTQADGPYLLQIENQGLGGGIASFNPNTTTFEKMKELGELSIIESSALYQQIVDYYRFDGISPERSGVEAWLVPWREMRLNFYGPLYFVQAWEGDGIPVESDRNRYAPEYEVRVIPEFDVEERRNNLEYMSLLGNLYQGQHYHEIRWAEILKRNARLQDALRLEIEKH